MRPISLLFVFNVFVFVLFLFFVLFYLFNFLGGGRVYGVSFHIKSPPKGRQGPWSWDLILTSILEKFYDEALMDKHCNLTRILTDINKRTNLCKNEYLTNLDFALIMNDIYILYLDNFYIKQLFHIFMNFLKIQCIMK